MPAGDAHLVPRTRAWSWLRPSLRRPRLIPSASSTLSRPMRSRQGSPVRKWVKASVNLVASSISSRMSVIRASGISPVEVGDPVRHCAFRPFNAEHAVFDAAASDRTGSRRVGQLAQTLVQRVPALGEPVVRTGRDRQAAVGISDGGNRQQRLPDIAVAARPRQPDSRRRGTRRAGGTTPPSPKGGIGCAAAGSTSNSAVAAQDVGSSRSPSTK